MFSNLYFIKISQIYFTILRICADASNKISLLRRKPVVQCINTGDDVRRMAHKLQPSSEFLFGGKISTICKTINESKALKNPLVQNKAQYRFAGKFNQRGGHTGAYSGQHNPRGAARGRGGRGGGRGGRGFKKT